MYSTCRIQWKPLLLSLLVSLGTGALSAFFTGDAMRRYGSVRRPLFAPPAWIFPAVWTVLFFLMAVSAYLVYESGCTWKKSALTVYCVQLAVNFFWPLIFFNRGAYFFAFVWLLLLWLLVLAMILLFLGCRRSAGLLQIPYLVWLTFAAYLNYFVWVLN